jgi:hypothetical protein
MPYLNNLPPTPPSPSRGEGESGGDLNLFIRFVLGYNDEKKEMVENYPVRQTKKLSGRLFVLPFESTQMCWVSPSAITSS